MITGPTIPIPSIVDRHRALPYEVHSESVAGSFRAPVVTRFETAAQRLAAFPRSR